MGGYWTRLPGDEERREVHVGWQRPGELQYFKFWRTGRSQPRGLRRRDLQGKRSSRRGLSPRPGPVNLWSFIQSHSVLVIFLSLFKKSHTHTSGLTASTMMS